MDWHIDWAAVIGFLFAYVFYFPFFMAYLWMAGGLAFHAQFEEEEPVDDKQPVLRKWPMVSILVPCYNEEATVREVILGLQQQRYPNYEIIAIDDGCTDRTPAILDELAFQYPNLRVIHQHRNQGKAVGLNTAAMLAKGELVLGIDADAILGANSIAHMVRHFLQSDSVGAVTGNPRIRTRTTMVGRMQVGEFSSTIGLIKRTQHLLGRLFTVSGVVAMFRRKALLEVGFWSPEMLTEDIDISWKLQIAGWRVRYEPRATCWILMPEKLGGLYKQRLRWAMGGVQTLKKFTRALLHPKHWRMWLIYLEYAASVLWAYAMALVLVLALLKYLVTLPPALQLTALPQWRGILLGMTCMLQVFTGLYIDRRYDHRLLRYYLWTIWYPVAFWMISMVTTVVAVPRVLLRDPAKRALWNNTDRGLRHAPPQ